MTLLGCVGQAPMPNRFFPGTLGSHIGRSALSGNPRSLQNQIFKGLGVGSQMFDKLARMDVKSREARQSMAYQ